MYVLFEYVTYVIYKKKRYPNLSIKLGFTRYLRLKVYGAEGNDPVRGGKGIPMAHGGRRSSNSKV